MGRQHSIPDRFLRIGRLKLDLITHQVLDGSRRYQISPMQSAILATLEAAGGSFVTTEQLIERAWQGANVSSSTVKSTISRLRRVLDGLGIHLPGARGRGYCLLLDQRDPTCIGREAEITRVCQYLNEGASLVTLAGSDGIGKTTLAVASARRLVTRHFCCPLRVTSWRESAMLMGEKLSICLNECATKTEILESIRLGIRQRGVNLLILENAGNEAFVAEMVDQLSPTCSMLATRQQSIGCATEQVVRLSPLLLADAREMFLARTGGSPGVDPNVDHLLELLEGVPLAIELAARWTRCLPIKVVVTCLQQTAKNIDHRTKKKVSRRGLATVIEWSWSILDRNEQRVASRMAVTSKPMCFWGVSACVGRVTQTRLVRALMALQRYGMLRVGFVGPEVRYSLRSAYVWQAKRCLPQDELAAASRRLKHWERQRRKTQPHPHGSACGPNHG
jgi:hypothetical protein